MCVLRRHLDWFIQQRRNVFFSISVRSTQYHDAVFNGQCIQMVQHHVIRFRQQCWFTLKFKALQLFDWNIRLHVNNIWLVKRTESGVSLFKMTWSKCGGRTGGPAPHGLSTGISWLYSFWALFTLSSLSLAKAWNTSKSDCRTDTKLFLEPTSLSTFFYWIGRKKTVKWIK